MQKGRVKRFNNEKGYGFIENNINPSEDIFVHYSAILCEGYKTLKEGDIVEFTFIETSKGGQAIDVKEVKLTTV
jgi:cold shock protein